MAIDTRNRRFSIARLGRPVGALPHPDGTIDTQDRAQHIGLYHGITLSEPSAFDVIGKFVYSVVQGLGRFVTGTASEVST